MTNDIDNNRNRVLDIKISSLTLKACIPLQDATYLAKYSNSMITTNNFYHEKFLQSEIERIQNNELFITAINSDEPIECLDNNNYNDCKFISETLGMILAIKVECDYELK